jgi:hypothetical protein
MTLRLASLAAVLLLATGCYTVDVVAPKGETIELLPASATVETARQWRAWYAGFGLIPMDPTMPREMLVREKLTRVRVDVVDTVPDAFIGLLYNVLIPIGLGVQSMKVHGNAH